MAKEKKDEKDFAQKVREYFGMPEPGQKNIVGDMDEWERQTGRGKVPTKAGEPKKKRK